MLVLLASLLQLLLYWTLQSTHIFLGDSSEYSTVAYTWSIAHPPGYPLYSLLINTVRTLLFFVPSYVPANLLSIIPTILSTVLIYKIVFEISKNKYLSVFSGLFFSFLFPVWLYAEVPEVFALHTALSLGITLMLLRFKKNHHINLFFVASFLLGLAFTHHHTVILFLPGWYIMMKDHMPLIKKKIRKGLLFFFLGFSFYIYAPIASLFNPPIDWENAKTPDGFIRLITRSSYGTFKAFSTSRPHLMNQIFDSFSTLIFLIQDFRIIGIVFILLGILNLYKKNRPFFYFVILGIFSNLFFYFYSNFPLQAPFIVATFERFLIPLYAILIFPFAFGIQYVYEKTRVFFNIYITNNWLKHFTRFLIVVFFLSYFAIVFWSNFKSIRKLRNTAEFETYAKNVLDTPPKNSILAMKSDVGFFTTAYYYYVKKYRNDLIFIFPDLFARQYYIQRLKKIYPQLFFPVSSSQQSYLKVFLEKNSEKYEIFFESQPTSGSWLPYGLLWKYYPTEEKAIKDIGNIVRVNRTVWKQTYKFPRTFMSDSKILHLESIRQTYGGALELYCAFLKKNGYDAEALSYLNFISDSLNLDSPYMDKLRLEIYTTQKKCNLGLPLVEKYLKRKTLLDSSELAAVLKYYYFCDQENKNVYNLLEMYNKKKNTEGLPLKKI